MLLEVWSLLVSVPDSSSKDAQTNLSAPSVISLSMYYMGIEEQLPTPSLWSN